MLWSLVLGWAGGHRHLGRKGEVAIPYQIPVLPTFYLSKGWRLCGYACTTRYDEHVWCVRCVVLVCAAKSGGGLHITSPLSTKHMSPTHVRLFPPTFPPSQQQHTRVLIESVYDWQTSELVRRTEEICTWEKLIPDSELVNVLVLVWSLLYLFLLTLCFVSDPCGHTWNRTSRCVSAVDARHMNLDQSHLWRRQKASNSGFPLPCWLMFSC